MSNMGCRSTVHPLFIGVSGSLYTGFSSYKAAASDDMDENISPVENPIFAILLKIDLYNTMYKLQ